MKPQRRADRAGLTLPPARVRQVLKQFHPGRHVAADAEISVTAGVESVIADLIDQVAMAVRAAGGHRVMARHVVAAVRADGELATLFAELALVGDTGLLVAEPFPDGPTLEDREGLTAPTRQPPPPPPE